MSKTGRTPSRSVFIGNIAYESTREQLTDIFTEVGPVVNLRIVTDRETGRPKGYAFCEYKDEASALSAMRNLNDRELNGRLLRVDFADGADRVGGSGGDDDHGFRGGRDDLPMQDHPQMQQMPHQQQQSQQQQQQQQQHVNPVDPVMGALMQLPKNQLYEAAAQMKHLVMTNPERARQILTQNPTMALVMLHIQYLLGMVNQPWTPQQGHVAKKPDFAAPSILGLPPPNVGIGAPMMAPPSGPPLSQHRSPPMNAPSSQVSGAPNYFGGPQGPNVSHGIPGSQHPGPFPQGPRGGPVPGGGPHQPPYYGGHPQQQQQQQQQHQQQQQGPYGHQHPQQQQQQHQQQQMGTQQPIQLSREQFQSMVQNIPQDTLAEIIKVTPQQLQQLPPQERQQVMLIQHHMRMYAPALMGGGQQ